ncbi:MULTISPECIES: hypothetical protein [Streptomyces]|uniref:hypothetical protein n=1 Tax=Streptomyces TaxID=1883 RepID=UPI0034191BA4
MTATRTSADVVPTNLRDRSTGPRLQPAEHVAVTGTAAYGKSPHAHLVAPRGRYP